LSAAVAARSAGCSYAFDEMSVYGSIGSGNVSIPQGYKGPVRVWIVRLPGPRRVAIIRPMGRARVLYTVAGSVRQAQACWYDTTRWPVWVDGLEQVLQVDGDWPWVGSSVTWESGPAGRGRVTERVIAYDAAQGQTLEVDDASIRGLQSVSFAPASNGVQVGLSLEYRLKMRSIVSPLVDLLFIRRAMAVSLEATVARFAVELSPH
jgi:hypothetical protein